jgi:drug/metabolite transporter (DMT)-like permease
LSVLYPVLATSYIWVGWLSVRYLGEPFSGVQWAGVVLIVLGIGLIVR